MTGTSTSRSVSSHNGGSFWARQTSKDKVAIVAFVAELAISVGLLLVTVFVKDSALSIGTRFALLTGNIVALVATLQFAISRFFDDQKDQIDKVSSEMEGVQQRISRTLEEMESITALGETYIKIFRQEEGIKEQYQSTLDAFLRRLSSCIDDKRSGALDIMDYYGALEDLASAIKSDQLECEAAGIKYNGGIWALSFFLDDEWDDSSIHEIRWFESLKRLDQSGIPTRRLWAFDKKILALVKKDPIEEDGREILRRLSLYCSDKTEFANTSSYALPKSEMLDEHVRLFGKGFFAAAFSNGDFRLIRGVCFDNLLSSNTLGGEIDFDEIRIRQIRIQWERYLALAGPLKEYLHGEGSKSAQEFMQTAWGFNIP
jgi:hypothetical protein